MPTRQELADKTAKEYFLEQAAAYFDDLKATAHNAPYGQFLNCAEAIALDKGRDLIRQSLETLVQEEIHDIEKKKETTLCPQCQTKKRHQGYRWKKINTANGSVKLERRYDACLPCHLPEHVADAHLGLEHRYTIGLRRLAVRAGGANSFEQAEDDLREYCGLELSHMTIRELCQQEAPKMKKWQKESSEIQKDFIQAPGVVEVTMDGTCVNTTQGWKETKVGIISKRPLGEGVSPEQWDDRTLPRHSACVAFAAIEEKALFQERFNQWRQRLQLGAREDISALGDGAAWIWNIILAVFGKIRENLDVYHGLEHVSDTGKVLYGEGTQEYERWRAETTLEFLQSGFEDIEKRLDNLEQEPQTDKEKGAVRLLRGYLDTHRDRLCYRKRLSEGRAIGSGQIEGACKNLIGRRLKQTGAKWTVPRLNRMTILCAIRYSSHWSKYWKNAK